MEVDDDDVIVKRRPTRGDTKSGIINKVKRDQIDSDDEDDDVLLELDVVVCESSPRTDVYRVQLPARKKHAFHPDNTPRCRFKKNVKLLEMRMHPDTATASYDKSKAERFSGGHAPPLKNEPGIVSKADEVYEGRAFANPNPLSWAVASIKDGKLFLNPLSGNFEMHRSVAHMNNVDKKGNRKDDGGDETGESEGEGPKELRTKFIRPETERQKKRREASALHREKAIASDTWINMQVYLEQDPEVRAKCDPMMRCEEGVAGERKDTPSLSSLVEQAILEQKAEQLDLSRGDQLSLKRIRALPANLQVKALVIKSQMAHLSSVSSLLSVWLSRGELLCHLQACAHLVRGVWVLDSSHLFARLPPANPRDAAPTCQVRTEIWRAARDFCLMLLDAGARLTRGVLRGAFSLSDEDALNILKTVGKPGDRSYELFIEPDTHFLKNPENLRVIVEEKKWWQKRREEVLKVSAQLRGV